ncbi:prohormone-2-like [Pseudomyrmex gracilis]|uniref:prohormone-2-like n=1 Tax=Pseudomyrmex gracilis TaxID=219809 RepID=UPI000994EBC9|nr:prohormone-2-like [Pseudomyrmex gracilis]
MTHNWAWLLLLFSLVSTGMCMPASLMEDLKKADQASEIKHETMKPKSKRAQEMLIFGNQQNQQAQRPATSESFTSKAEKRNLDISGLERLKAALAGDDKASQQTKSANKPVFGRETYLPFDRNYDYDKVLMNEVEEEAPRVWNVPPYSRYYASEDRRKRSEKSTATELWPSTTLQPPTSSFQPKRLASLAPTRQPVQAQVKRSAPYYQEPRFKRDLTLDIDPEDLMALLSLWENERQRASRNWRRYAGVNNDEYENGDDGGYLDEEAARNVLPWPEFRDAPMYSPRHYDSLSPSDIGIIRTHPPSYDEQYGDQTEQQFERAAHDTPVYGNVRYDYPYPQRDYPYDKRFTTSKKWIQNYDPYLAQLQMSSQPRGYSHHIY